MWKKRKMIQIKRPGAKNDSNFVRKKGKHSKNNAFRRLLQAGLFQKRGRREMGKTVVLCAEGAPFPNQRIYS